MSEQGLLQRRTPDAVRSRVAGAVEAATLLSLAVSLPPRTDQSNGWGRAPYYVSGVMTLLAAPIMHGPMRSRASPRIRRIGPRVRGAGAVTADRVANPLAARRPGGRR